MSWPKHDHNRQRGGKSYPPTNPNAFLSNGANLPSSKALVTLPQDEEHGLKAKTILKVEIKK
jgi:hypothetical protein